MSTTYDIIVSSPFSNYDFFVHKMEELCGQMTLSFFAVNDVWVKEFLQKVKSGDVSVRVLLDLTANQTIADDPYTQLAREVMSRGGYVIDDPDKTIESAHKGRFHKKMVKAGIPVPETIIVDRADLKTFQITDEIKRRVGVPFVVKPAWGDSGVGVQLNGTSEDALFRSAEEAPNSDAFLIQQRVQMADLGRHKGWFRMFYICSTVIACWWDPVSHEYHLVTPSQIKKYKLNPLRLIMRAIAKLSGMKKFSAEICLDGAGKFYSVDSVNADPDMNPRSFYENGVPDEIVRHIVWLLFMEGLRTVNRGRGYFDEELSASEAGADWLEQRRLEQAQGSTT